MPGDRPAIAYYITPHGYGHAVRSLEILRRLSDLRPDVEPTIISDLPDSLLEQGLGRLPKLRRLRLEFGLYQNDSIQFDLEKSLELLSGLNAESEAIIEREVSFLKRERIQVVVSDIGWLPFEAAARCGLVSIGISNFTWDWIYGAYVDKDPRWAPVISGCRSGYRKCSLFLRLPMHGDCSACPNIEDVPLVARKAGKSRSQVRSILGLRDDDRVVLVSFVTLQLSQAAIRNLKAIQDTVFLYKGPMEFDIPGAVKLDEAPISFPDAVGAADAVLTKPGYGIVSECLAQSTPIIYTERGDMVEYDVLVDTIEQELTSVFIDSRNFNAGNWEPSIRKALSLPRRAPARRVDGADVCAQRILALSQTGTSGRKRPNG